MRARRTAQYFTIADTVDMAECAYCRDCLPRLPEILHTRYESVLFIHSQNLATYALTAVLSLTHPSAASSDTLTPQEIDEVCEAWQPEPLVTEEAINSVVKRKDRVVTKQQKGCRVEVDGKVLSLLALQVQQYKY